MRRDLPQPSKFLLHIHLSAWLTKGCPAPDSVCLFGVLRVHTLVRLNLDDLSYGVGNLAIYSLLEPLLGLVGCCLMVLQPVISKLTQSRIWPAEQIQMSDRKESLIPEPSQSNRLLPI